MYFTELFYSYTLNYQMNSFRAFKLKLGCHGEDDNKARRNLFDSLNVVEDVHTGDGGKEFKNQLVETPVKSKSLKNAIYSHIISQNNNSVKVENQSTPKYPDYTEVSHNSPPALGDKENFPPADSRSKSPSGEIFSCKFCQRTFSYYCHLKVHERIHTGEKPYSCKHCSQNFSQLGSLTVHMRIHTGEKPYDCSKCAKRFRHINSLRRHQRQVHLMTKDDLGQLVTSKRKSSSDSDEDQASYKRTKITSDVKKEPEVTSTESWSSLRHGCSGQIITTSSAESYNPHLALLNYYTTLLGAAQTQYGAIYPKQYLGEYQRFVPKAIKNEYSSADEGFVSNSNISDDGTNQSNYSSFLSQISCN